MNDLKKRANDSRLNERRAIKYFAELGVMYHEDMALIIAQQSAIESLTAQLEEAKENQRIAIEALEFYANKETHNDEDGAIISPVYFDKGKLAEQALSTIRGK